MSDAIVCLTHLRWDFVFQRPQHLMTRLAKRRRIVFYEEAVVDDGPTRLEVRDVSANVQVIVPHVSRTSGRDPRAIALHQRQLLDGFMGRDQIRSYVLWYYTPMALAFSAHLQGQPTVYDCMDELSLFVGAPPDLCRREAELLRRADLVLTGGQSLYEAKRGLHANVHALPSSVDCPHFAAARVRGSDPLDQASIAHPRIGYAGVIDERMDLDLIAAVAAHRPNWQLVLLGPVTKIDPATLPRAANIHYLGMKPYADLPAYMAGWDAGMLPFGRNEATRFISPTKTPEYLAAGLPVVSTSIRDVVAPYGQLGLAHIADTPAEFVRATQVALSSDPRRHRAAADGFLASTSWDETVRRVERLLERTRSAAFMRATLPIGLRAREATDGEMADV